MATHLEHCFTEKGRQGLCNLFEGSIECRNQILKNYPIRNSKGNLVWDVLFRMLMEEMESDFGFVSCEAFIANRGCWNFALIYSDGVLFSIMREQRFTQLQKELTKNSKSTHYAVSLARILNVGVKNQQGCLFSVTDDEVDQRSADITSKLLQRLDIDSDLIEGFVMILIDADDTHLYSVRMVLVNGALEICDEYSLKDYIQIKEPIIVESVQEYPDAKPDDPSKNLKLTGKAEARKAKRQGALKQISASEVNENIK